METRPPSEEKGMFQEGPSLTVPADGASIPAASLLAAESMVRNSMQGETAGLSGGGSPPVGGPPGRPPGGRTAPPPSEELAPPLPGELASPPGPFGLPTSIAERPAEKDLLDRESFVAALAALFQSDKQGTPLTMGLFGPWGTGKTTILQQVEARLRKEAPGRFAFATFNAWGYEHTGNLAAGLAQEVVNGLVGCLGFWEKLWLRVRFAAQEHKWGILKALSGLLLAALPALFAWIFAGLDQGPSLPAGLLGLGGVAVFVWFAEGAFRDLRALWGHPLSSQLFTYLKLPQYGEHLGLLPVLKRHMKTLCGMVLEKKGKPARRFIVFIDDLDRCAPEGVVAVFEAVRLVMDLPQVFVVIAMDGEVALKAIAGRYGREGDGGAADMAREYLGKIVQVPIQLSAPASLDRYFAEGLFPGVTLTPRTGKVPKHPLDPERPAVSAGTLTGAMVEEDEEADRFRELAKTYRFTAPRLLLRLRNSYRLLKLFNLLRAEAERYYRPKFLMKLLFFAEFLAQKGERAGKQEQYLKDLERLNGAALVQGLDGAVLLEARNQVEADERHHLGVNAGEVLGFVRSVVLPGYGGTPCD